MAATGKTPILLYGSTTPTNAPAAGNLTNSSDGCEIAINVADKNLFFKDSTNSVNTVPIRQSSGSSDGWLSSANWTTFNNKQAALVSGTNIKTVSGTTLLGSGDLGTIGVGYGGTGTSTTFTTGSVVFAGASGVYTQDNTKLFWDNTNKRLGIGTNTPGGVLHAAGQSVFYGNGTAPAVWGDTTASGILSYDGSNNPIIRANTGLGLILQTNGNNTRLTLASGGDVTVNTGNLVIGTSGKGIDFSATAGTGTSELLADYEKGTWTPVLYDDSLSPSEGQTYSVQYGEYVKIGDFVFVKCRIRMTSLGTLTTSQAAQIGGLPYTSAATNISSGYVGECSGLNLAAVNAIAGYVPDSSTVFRLRKFSAVTGTAAVTIAEVTASGNISFSACYTV